MLPVQSDVPAQSGIRRRLAVHLRRRGSGRATEAVPWPEPPPVALRTPFKVEVLSAEPDTLLSDSRLSAHVTSFVAELQRRRVGRVAPGYIVAAWATIEVIDTVAPKDGLAEEVITMLGQVPGLRVAGLRSAFEFRDRDTPLPVVAEQLRVATVLDGSVCRSSGALRITTRLVSGEDGFQLWGP
jgi:hypothetical protein